MTHSENQAGGRNDDRSGILQRLRPLLFRRTRNKSLIREIDGLRALAILAVVTYHASGNYSAYVGPSDDSALSNTILELISAGRLGVQLFFVISGFVLSLPFASYFRSFGPKPSLARYFIRRITRLEPPYLVALTGIFVARSITSSNAQLLENYLASIAYVHSIIYGTGSAITYVAWSLEVEVQFYILAPLLAACLRSGSAVYRRTALVVAIFAATFMSHWFPDFHLSLLGHLHYFLSGMLLADLYVCGACSPGKAWPLWDTLALLCLSGSFVAKAYAPTLTPLLPWIILSGYLGVMKGGLSRRLFSNDVAVIIGGMCYSIYLWHFFVIGGARPFLFQVLETGGTLESRMVYVLAANLVALVFGLVAFVLIERPTMDPQWPSKLYASTLGKLRGT